MREEIADKTQMIANRSPCLRSVPKLILLLLAASGPVSAQYSSVERKLPKPGIKEVQIPFASIKPSATIKVGATAEWVLVTDDAVWFEHEPLRRAPN